LLPSAVSKTDTVDFSAALSAVEKLAATVFVTKGRKRDLKIEFVH